MYSLKYYELNAENSSKLLKMKLNDSITTHHQLAIDSFDDMEHTTITHLGSSTYNGYDRLKINYEEKENINGRYRNEPIYYYIANEELAAFKSKNGPYLYIRGSLRKKDSALNELDKNGIIKVKKYTVDLIGIKNNLNNIFITGGWFAGLQIANISSAGIFGADVNDSDMWSQFEKQGQLSALTIQLNTEKCPLSLQISRNGNILYYKTWKETESIRIAESTIELIKDYFIYDGEKNEKVS